MIGKEPQPKDPEIVEAERICDEMREIAKKLPTPDGPESEERVIQFGNNFFLLFLSLMKEENSQPELATIDTYLRRAEDLYGKKWELFLKDNHILITQIKELLKQKEIFGELFENMVKIYKNPRTREIGKKIRNELKLQAINIEIWSKLNPLLIRANEAMIQDGMDPKKFYV